jgi:hypothetical protein
MKLILLNNKYSIYKFPIEATLPDWVYSSDFYSITKTTDEFSVVTLQVDSQQENLISSKDWRILKIMGPLDLSLIGVISEISGILKNASIAVFIISTYDTDYILMKHADTDRGIQALKEKGHIAFYEDE